MGNQDAPKAPAGWYPIGADEIGERYWDGQAWTGETKSLQDDSVSSKENLDKNPKKKTLIILGSLALPAALFFSFLMQGIEDKTEVPFVYDYSAEEATKLLETEGFEVEILEESSPSEVEKGVVLRTMPNVGNFIDKGSKVILIVSKGSDSADKLVPNSTTSWQPSGFTAYNEELAYMWVSGGPNPCGSMACSYFTMDVISHFGCPKGVYVEINMTSEGVVVDWSNDTVPALAAGQTAQLQFITYQQNVDTGQIANMTCR